MKLLGNKYMHGVLALLMSFNLSAYTCVTAVPETTPLSDFTEHDNGTVTHHKTTLMWQICSQGQVWENGRCAGTATTHNWQEALQIPAILNVSGGYAGYTDWRLPNITELSSIVELRCVSPAINQSVFPSSDSLEYWTSSPVVEIYLGNARNVHFGDGSIFHGRRDNNYRVRLVRCCSSDTSGTINPDSAYDGVYDLTVTSTTPLDMNGLPCKDATGAMMIINSILSGVVTDDWGDSYDVEGDVQSDGIVSGGFAVSGTNAATFDGVVSGGFASGSWVDIYQCAGVWQAIKN